jgi:hypothetical protein
LKKIHILVVRKIAKRASCSKPLQINGFQTPHGKDRSYEDYREQKVLMRSPSSGIRTRGRTLANAGSITSYQTSGENHGCK